MDVLADVLQRGEGDGAVQPVVHDGTENISGAGGEKDGSTKRQEAEEEGVRELPGGQW